MKLSQIRALVMVAKCGKFSEAAMELELTQPTVSHAIAAMESELGIQLLFRGSKGVSLTPAGESILVHCHRVLDSLEDIYLEANRHKGLDGGKVRISAFRGAAAQLLPRIKAGFKSKHPQIEVQIVEEKDCPQVEQAIRQGGADLGFTTLPVAEDLDTIEILRDDYLVLLPPDSSFPNYSQLSWEQLISMPIISYPDRNSCYQAIASYYQDTGYCFQPCEQVRESDTIINLVATGLGAAILPRLSVFHVPEGVKVCQLPTSLQRVVVAVTLAEQDLSHAVWALVDFLRETQL
ncbi:MAG: LysR family transcriptional regulator [Pleurocapsa sp.]